MDSTGLTVGVKMAKQKVIIKYNANWEVHFEYQFGKDLITPGTEIKFKNTRGSYKFQKHVINHEKKVEWFDVTGIEGYKSFYVQELKGIVKPKIRRQKNV